MGLASQTWVLGGERLKMGDCNESVYRESQYPDSREERYFWDQCVFQFMGIAMTTSIDKPTDGPSLQEVACVYADTMVELRRKRFPSVV